MVTVWETIGEEALQDYRKKNQSLDVNTTCIQFLNQCRSEKDVSSYVKELAY